MNSRDGRWRTGGTPVLVVVALVLAACGGGSPAASTDTGPTTAPAGTRPTLGARNPGCEGCGEISPAKVVLLRYAASGSVFAGIVFTHVVWRSWGSSQAVAPAASAYYVSPGERGTVTLYAFDLGRCGGAPAYRALEWVSGGAARDSAAHYDTCTGRGVGPGFPA